MTDMALISGAITSLNAAMNIAKGIVSAHDIATIQSKVIELQSEIMAAQSSALNAQSEQFMLLSRIGELEKEVADLKAWDVQSKQYELVQIGNGCVAFMRKREEGAPRQPAWYCATCFENKKKSPLQFQNDFQRHSVFHCSTCNSKISVPGGETPDNFR
jgi:hypothetical protein